MNFRRLSAITAGLVLVGVAAAGPVTASTGELPIEGYVVTDQPGGDAAAIQAGLDLAAAAGGGLVYLPDRDYQLDGPIEIGSGTELRLSPRTTVHRATDRDYLVTNKHDGTTGGYGQAHDITVTGGTWDGAAESYSSNSTMLLFGHAERITITGATFRNLGGAYHFVELNSTRGGRITGNTFTGLAGTGDPARPDHAEMVQIDLARSANAFIFGPYDYTPVVDLLVQGNTFRGGMRGVGSHSQNAGYPHRDVRIIDNSFEDLTSRAITPLNTEGLVVQGNTARNVATFFRYDAPPVGQWIRGVTVQNNSVDNDLAHQDTVQGRGIAVFGGTDVGSRRLSDVTISGNVLDGMGKHGITVDFTTRATISGNTVRDTGRAVTDGISSSGMWIWRANDTSVTGNQIVNTAPGGGGGDQADLIVGAASGGINETGWVTVVGNSIGRLRINPNVIGVLVGDNMLGSVASTAPASNVRIHDNVIAGAWAP